MEPATVAAAAAAAEAALEAELAAFLAPDETAASLLARTFVAPLRTGLPLVDHFTSLRGRQLLEIASAAGCGRTTALLQIAATCILPEVLGGVAYGGRGGGCCLQLLLWWRRRVPSSCWRAGRQAGGRSGRE